MAMSQYEILGKRPILVFLTQALLLLAAVLATYWLLSALIMVQQGHVQRPPLLRVLSGTLLIAACVALLGYVFYGLARRRQWSWRGSIGLATILAAWLTVLYFKNGAAAGVSPQFDVEPSERFGEAVGRASLPLLAWAYALRLYFSRRVRGFLGVPQRGLHGR